MTLRLVQLQRPNHDRRIARVEDDRLRLLKQFDSVFSLAWAALERKTSLVRLVEDNLSADHLDYDPVYRLESEWRLLPALDHPHEEGRCLVSGTGLTHKSSALTRQAMHVQEQGGAAAVTDSLRMLQWGLEGGRPAPGQVGAQPEWFYKGRGEVLRAHGEPLDVPAFADDGGEEGELVGLYFIAPDGTPRRLGLCTGNEFSDHVMERKNYLYLAPSKLRTCAIGPELVVDAAFDDVRGTARVERGGQTLWTSALRSGRENMSHTLANLEHHHFKYPSHRRPGDVHVHFLGADSFSFGEKIRLQNGDVLGVEFEGLGRPLRNTVRWAADQPALIRVEPL
jgi:hypothetical protein